MVNKKSSIKDNNFFIDNLKEALLFVKESKKYIYSIALMFLIFSIIGFFIPPPDLIEKQIIDNFKEIIEKTEDMSGLEISIFIILNNLQVSFIGLILGVFIGIIPIFIAISNGYIIGFVSSLSVSSAGFSSLFLLLPHGIFELPAVIISLGIGLRLGSLVFRYKKNLLKKELILSLKTFIYIILPLLVLAGIIEGFLIYLIK